MKKIIIGIIIIVFFTGCNNSNKIEINSPAFMYNTNSSINKEVSIVLSGFFNEKENNFNGSMTINNIKLETILFSPGSGLISYNGKTRTYLGEIFFNHKTKQYTIELGDSKLYETLSQQKYDNNKLIISSPAQNLEEAKQINTTLKSE